MRSLSLGIVLIVAATAAFGQTTLGSLPNNANGIFASAPYTIVDLAHPAAAAGTVSVATVRWFGSSAACNSAFKLKILRPVSPFGTYSTVADRGPFSTPSGDSYVVVGLTNPVTIQRGDVLAVVQLKPAATCGAVMFAPEKPEKYILNFDADIPSTGAFVGATPYMVGALAARVTSDLNVLDGIVTVAGSASGANNSFFRTSMQLSNPDNAPMHGKIVFHPSGTSASAGDRFAGYTLPAHGSMSIPDVVAALNASGLGSIDIVTASSAPPIVQTRIFNDLGVDGTSGFTEPMLPPSAALGANEIGNFSVAPDLTNYRMNVGIRTLGEGAQVSIRQYDVNGTQVGSAVGKTYPASYFEQVSLASFLGGQTPLSGSLVRISVENGSIIIYASTTDNRTNDSSVFFVGR
ncbi:MAG: hypothetical protein JWN02_738 [Acidobacteria bacterium]|nr:hypothetical protein [Acidobacteriota bacterium]